MVIEMEMVIICLEIIGVCIIFFALGLLLKGDGSSEQRLMGYFITGSLIQNVGYLLELTAPTMEAAVAAVKIQYTGSIFVPLCYCWFMFLYCYKKPPMKLITFLAAVDLCTLVVVFTGDRHTFYYKELGWLATESGHYYLDITYGSGYVIFLVFGCVIPYVISICILVQAILTKSEHVVCRKYKTIMALSILPILALISYIVKLTNIYDLTPVVLGIVLSMVVILIWGRKDYDFQRLAADTVLYSMSDGVIVLDDERRLISYNPAVANIFPELRLHAAGDSVRELKDFPEDILSEGGSVQKEFELKNNFYETHVKQIADKNGENQGYVILFLDVTETKRYIGEIKQVREQAEQANMAKSEFLANMSHEIRTPMNAIVGLSDIIMEESQGRKVYSYACDIKSASQNLLAIINDILDLSKVEAGKMELVLTDYYIKAVVGEVVGMMDIAASQHGLLLKCEYDMSIPCQFHGDAGRIKQILINLLNNAVKFTKSGYVKISVGGQAGTEDGVEELCFRVEDTGCGIEQENLGRIFEDFRQVDSKRNRSVEGTGLGLSITMHLVQLMEGPIEVESVYGEGSVFTVKIPQRIVDGRTLEELPDVPVREEEQVETFIARGYKVLVVDDNLINRKVAVGFLKHYEFDLAVASSGQEAIDMVKETKYDLIFMDHMMPGMDGIETVQMIRNECGINGTSPVVIALTANAMEGVRERFLENGFQDFITKPLERGRLNEVLVKWVPDEKKSAEGSGNRQDAAGEAEIGLGNICIRGIDVAEARKHQSGDADDYRELLSLYCIDGKRKLVLLKELLERRDYETYQIEVHGLKSASANIGAVSLSKQAREHEEAAKGGDEEFIIRHFPDLFSAYERQLSAIQSYLDEGERDRGGSEALSALEREELRKRVGEALESVKKFRSRECADRVKELLGYGLDADTERELRDIQEQLKLYEDDAAEELLRKLLNRLDS